MFVISLHLFNIERICWGKKPNPLKRKDRLRYPVFQLSSVIKEKCHNYLNILLKIASKTGLEREKAKSKNPQKVYLKWKTKEHLTVTKSHCTNITITVTPLTCHYYWIICATDRWLQSLKFWLFFLWGRIFAVLPLRSSPWVRYLIQLFSFWSSQCV